MQMDMLGEEAALRVLWGKSAGDGGYHPLVCHVIDVAMVASRIWNSVLSPPARQRVAMALGLPETDAGQWIAFWA
ncbi:MAG: hypothetical protein HYY04_11510, partial [Chloroflexi bacterium]|nr:hypothetical protein [Chloroflexota bacterium]